MTVETRTDEHVSTDVVDVVEIGQHQVDPEEVLHQTRTHLNKGRATLGELLGGSVEVAGTGPYIFDHEGRRFLQCGGYGVFILGHCHPRVTEAVVRQVMTHPMATRLLLEPTSARAATALAAIAPPGLDRVHFANSGSEATEAAIKMARSVGHTRLISTENGYHGKTMGALSVTMREVYQAPFEPLLPQVSKVPYGDAEAVREELARDATPAAVIVEPVQGEGGVNVPPPGYLARVRELCDEFGALMIVDEVFTGLGRTGAMWGCDHDGVVPDLMLVAKGLSGGVVPVSAVVAKAAVYEKFNRDPMLHSSTYAGAPVAMAAAEAAIGAIVDEDVPARARKLGEILLAGFREIAARRMPHLVREVRGAGLLLGLEFHDASVGGDFLLELIDQGVIVSHSLNSSSTVRFTPPVCLSDTDVELLLAAVDTSAAYVQSVHPA